MAIPKEGYFELEKGRYGPVFPKTPANYGFTIIAKIKPGREDAIRAHGKTLENAVAGDPFCSRPPQAPLPALGYSSRSRGRPYIDVSGHLRHRL